ncbi:RcnB family protein [Parasphingopyxis algicola]|uniref:RcnB family protein n=1 Tax=Parasphingopyxis algicola TaxID=2026624 RepID=UPI00248456E3|nr:RcnB family protein [Parasphingopyxis algicola]
MGAAFFGSRYLINDPWQYRLPAAYGPYRWIRYYDDVLLVDVRNGYVVDVIHDFFW